MKLARLSTLEVAVTLRPETARSVPAVCDVLVSAGLKREAIAVSEDSRGVHALFYTRSFSLLQKIRGVWSVSKIPGARLRWKVLKREDWFDKWMTDLGLIRLGRKIVMVPLWRIKEFRGGGKKMPVYLDPKGASGSGQHPSTQIMCLLMEPLEGKFQTFLDLGAGSGILSAAAHRLGADFIHAVDNDRMSVDATAFNLKENGAERYKVECGDVTRLKVRGTFDLVAANLVSSLLLKAKTEILSKVKPGGWLAVSGIHLHNFEEFRRAFRHPAFSCRKVIKRRGWAGFLYRRSG